MIASDIIKKKRNGENLSEEELNFFITRYVNGEIPDYQMAALMMAIYFRGMSAPETACLTRLMVESGDTVDLSAVQGIKVDKHSTGGVGDTTTLVLAPLVAAAGVPVAKMSGRGLGHTGGTLDKMEAIPGMTVSLTSGEFIAQVQKIGIGIIGQTADLVPADRKMYALRDVTATIDSIPLIAASVMSKKIAAGADAIVLDVKMGNGAFMTNFEDACRLSEIMVDIGTLVGRKVIALITDMSQPLGTHIGNALEVKEAIEILQGQHENSALYDVSLTLGSYMLLLAGVVNSPEQGRSKLAGLIKSGQGLEKFRQLIHAQHGDPGVVHDLSRLPAAEHIINIPSPKEGYVSFYDTENIGRCALLLGAGRETKEDPIDPAVGLILRKRIGDRVELGEPLAEIHARNSEKAESVSRKFLQSVSITSEKPITGKLVRKVIARENMEEKSGIN